MALTIVAATQMVCTPSRDDNIARATSLVRQAAKQGARLILLQELFETPYFCKDLDAAYLNLALPAGRNPAIKAMQNVAKELGVVLPISFYERANNAHYNALALIDATGEVLGIYRKSHIPDGPGYQEKYYFSPGDTGFQVYQTAIGGVGVAICWDQWFPEAARILALQGADVICYPTAIGSEPQDPSIHSKDHWQRVMQGHAAANMVPVIASNRIGEERGESCALTFYGSSFITDITGNKLAEANERDETAITAPLDFARNAEARAAWGLFRDRRPDLYAPLLTLDGKTRGNT